jgi:methionine-gamma-lyase
MKTLEVRVRASCENARRLAHALKGHERVARIYYPGLEDDAGHALARRQMTDFGGVMAFDLVGGEREAEIFLDALNLARCAPSLGGVETLVSYPLYSSHNGFTDEQLRAAGVSPATVRFSLGIEAADDIIADVRQALDKIQNSELRTQDSA